MTRPLRILKRSARSLALIGRVVLLAAVVGSCDASGPSGPRGPGSFNFDLQSPNGSEGSAVFELTGVTGLGSVSSDRGDVYYDHAGVVSRIVVVMDSPGQIRFAVGADNVRSVPEVRVLQVADGENRLRESLSGYDVTVEPVMAGGAP